jgi:phosphopantothenoylcysteine decarboxylase/phosphopantothenate--cysteine ligase
MNKPHHLILGISGGIAAYKVPDLIRRLQAQAIEVKVVLTPAAVPLVGLEALRVISGNPVFLDGPVSVHDMDHIRLAQWGDLMLICPATANTIAKIANGIADNLLTTLALSFGGPLMLAPAMNSVMWRNPATLHNVATCTSRNIRVLPVANGPLACGDEGPGRMLDISTIAEYVLGGFLPQSLTGKKVLIASGPTAEPIDPVRVITNRSSGAMGAALAQAALGMGAEVTVVSGPALVKPPQGATVVPVETAAEMADAMSGLFDNTDICIMAAAVADFRPSAPAAQKLARVDTPTAINLSPNPDIAAALGERKRHQFLVGFSLETEPGTARAEKKMLAKRCDMMVVNQAREAIGHETTRITILTPAGEPTHYESMNKRDAAQNILLHISASLGSAHD